MRAGVTVGQLYAWTEPGARGDVVVRAIRITDVTDGFATGVVVRWKGRPKMRGVTVMLPDDFRFKLVEDRILGAPKKVRRKSALKDRV